MDGLREHRKCSRAQCPFPRLIGGDDSNRDMSGSGVVLQPIENSPAVDVRQKDIERHGRRPIFGGQCQGRNAERGDDCLEALFACRFEHEPRKREVVLDDEQHRRAQRQTVAIIADFVHRRRHRLQQRGRLASLACGIGAVAPRPAAIRTRLAGSGNRVLYRGDGAVESCGAHH